MSIRCWMGFHKWDKVVIYTNFKGLYLCDRCDASAWLPRKIPSTRIK